MLSRSKSTATRVSGFGASADEVVDQAVARHVRRGGRGDTRCRQELAANARIEEARGQRVAADGMRARRVVRTQDAAVIRGARDGGQRGA